MEYSLIYPGRAIINCLIIALFVIIGTSDGVGVGLGKSIRAFVKNDFYHPNPKLSSHIRFIKYHSEEPDLGQHVQPEQKEFQVDEEEEDEKDRLIYLERYPFDEGSDRRVHIRYDYQPSAKSQEAIQTNQGQNHRIRYLNNIIDNQRADELRRAEQMQVEQPKILQVGPQPVPIVLKPQRDNDNIVLSRYRFRLDPPSNEEKEQNAYSPMSHQSRAFKQLIPPILTRYYG